MNTLATIALWWCFLTGGLMACAVTIIVAWWLFDVTMTRLRFAGEIWRWYEAKRQRKTPDIIRAEALEDAAQVCERLGVNYDGHAIAAEQIRHLKSA